MATDVLTRREMLAGLASAAFSSTWAAETAAANLLAAWQHGAQQHIGIWRIGTESMSPDVSMEVPTRAHGLHHERNGCVLAVARRPGDWLLRWNPASGKTQWQWMDDDRHLNGHVIANAAGDVLWTTETDRDSGQGMVGVRDAASLEKISEWPSHGMDPHELVVLPEAVGKLPAGTLLVANGGISTLPETGRQKNHLPRMDASLVALHPGNGHMLGQWRLHDRHLSIRHITWNARSKRLGIALQAEHPSAAERARAPVMAVWDGDILHAAAEQPPMAGYGGDICALVEEGFAVSCPRADALVLFTGAGQYLRAISHLQAFALTARDGQWWSGGRVAALAVESSGHHRTVHPDGPANAWVFDNHWQVLTT